MSTPAQRVKARRDPAIFAAPVAIKPRTDLSKLELVVAGRRYPIGANIDGDHPWEMPITGAATVTLPIRSPDASLLQVLADEDVLQQAGVRCLIDDITYVVVSVNDDGTGLYTLAMEDEVAWRLRQFSSFLSANRKTTTRAGFVYRMVQEASRPPLAPMRAFIPEIDDPQPVAKASES